MDNQEIINPIRASLGSNVNMFHLDPNLTLAAEITDSQEKVNRGVAQLLY